MKYLIIYFSRTGTTKKVAESISNSLKCDSEEILDTQNREGALGYIKSGKDATLKKLTIIKNIKKNPKEYDMIIIGTPVWAWTMSTPIRTYISQNKDSFNKVAFFCTMGGSGSEKTFKDMEVLCGKKPLAVLDLKTKDVIKNEYVSKIEEFVGKL